jgi:succinate dehydrogenase/fumarate reductase flavoprotein subunit
MPVEVAPIAHYHMGGVRVNSALETCIPNLFAAGEAVGGANGANRLSGNAISEAFVFGEHAGTTAAARAKARAASGWNEAAAATALGVFNERGSAAALPNTAALLVELQALMADNVGPFRTEAKLLQAQRRLRQMQRELGALPAGGAHYDMVCLDWFDLRNMLLVAQCVVRAAIERKESRGAHQREDFPGMLPEWELNQRLSYRKGELHLERAAPVPRAP